MSVSGDGETVDSDVMVGAHAGNNIGHNVGAGSPSALLQGRSRRSLNIRVVSNITC